jgi:type VI secretion system secreted protein VgrG
MVLQDSNGSVLKNRPYRAWLRDGSVVEGVTDRNGASDFLTSNQEHIATIDILKRRE